jgi:hypothetical protein
VFGIAAMVEKDQVPHAEVIPKQIPRLQHSASHGSASEASEAAQVGLMPRSHALQSKWFQCL